MHDIAFLRKNPDALDRDLLRRGMDARSAEILEIDTRCRESIAACEELLAERRRISAEAKKMKDAGEVDAFEALRQKQIDSKENIAKAEAQRDSVCEKLKGIMMEIPNFLLPDIPDGKNDSDNKEVSRWGFARDFDFTPLKHYVLGVKMGLLDFNSAAELSGSRFTVLKGPLAVLHRALAGYMLDTHVSVNGFEEYWVPVLVRESTLEGSGHLPKFKEDLYSVGDSLWLIPTAEVYLSSIPKGVIHSQDAFPMRLTALTSCFRSEAGSAGRDVRGMFRQHQFDKVELVSVVLPDDSVAELEYITDCAEKILRGLGLPYRKVLLCSGDIGFSSCKTYDLEAWFPGVDGEAEDGASGFREVSSCSSCGDFQARRMGLRYRSADTGKVCFAHTLNGSGIAVGRCLVAVMENYQQADGSILIPEVIRPRVGGAVKITAEGEFAYV